jgi:hypothetical protein
VNELVIDDFQVIPWIATLPIALAMSNGTGFGLSDLRRVREDLRAISNAIKI